MRISLMCLFFLFGSQLHAQNNQCFDIARKGSLSDLMVIYNKDKTIVNAIDTKGSSMLILAAYYGNSEVALFLAEKVKNINYNSGMGTALLAAVVKGNYKIAQKLLQMQCDVNDADANNSTALHFAVGFKNVEMVKLLLEFNADLSLKDSNGNTAFELASKTNNEELISLLKH